VREVAGPMSDTTPSNAATPRREPTFADFLVDPLAPESRRTRRDLLIASTVGALAALGGLVPTKISALGIDLSLGAQKGLTWALAAVVLYLSVAFAVYGLSDYFNWRLRYQNYRERIENDSEGWTEQDQQEYDDMKRRVGDVSRLYVRAPHVAWARLVVDIFAPPVLGLAACISLCFRAWLG
jgi:hypothetical protein